MAFVCMVPPLFHTSHTVDSGFFEKTSQATRDTRPAEVSSCSCVCVCCVLCGAQMSSCRGKCLAFESFWKTFLCLTVSKSVRVGKKNADALLEAPPVGSLTVEPRDISAGLSIHAPPSPSATLTIRGCLLISTPRLPPSLARMAAGHQFVDKSPFLNSIGGSISRARRCT